ncbi:hypothetical protein LCGC14_1696580 [marine sediment metagenome]|uniref:Uncharacterized protein n=1 Tax=marine sediment metagenome TaxID=412755 RepID=A0A0F9HJ13_9ZZZZ
MSEHDDKLSALAEAARKAIELRAPKPEAESEQPPE